MKKSLFPLLLGSTLLWGSQNVATYTVEHSIWGEIANVEVFKEIAGDSYTAELVINTTGMAAVFSSHLQKRFISQGSFHDGRFYPDVLMVMQHKDDHEKFLVYRFDHHNKILHVDKCATQTLIKSSFNIRKMEFDEYEYSEFTYDTHRAESYVRDDVISLYFNAKNYMSDHHDEKQISLMAAGIYDYDAQEENIDGVLAFGISQEDIGDILKTSIANDMLSVSLSEKVFHADDKWLYIDLNEDSLPQRVKLNNIALGDVMIERIIKN
jgi:hypothetical protein